jgi:hypothetical protein
MRYGTPERRGLLYRRILDVVRTIPGIESGGAIDALPFSGENHGGLIGTAPGAGEADDHVPAEINLEFVPLGAVTEAHFDKLFNINVRRGSSSRCKRPYRYCE